jgi:hypothetical protein
MGNSWMLVATTRVAGYRHMDAVDVAVDVGARSGPDQDVLPLPAASRPGTSSVGAPRADEVPGPDGCRRSPSSRRAQWVEGSVAISVRSPDQRVWKVPPASVRR